MKAGLRPSMPGQTQRRPSGLTMHGASFLQRISSSHQQTSRTHRASECSMQNAMHYESEGTLTCAVAASAERGRRDILRASVNWDQSRTGHAGLAPATWGCTSVATAAASACGGKDEPADPSDDCSGVSGGRLRVGGWGCGAHLDRFGIWGDFVSRYGLTWPAVIGGPCRGSPRCRSSRGIC